MCDLWLITIGFTPDSGALHLIQGVVRAVHEITAGHRSLSSTISFVTDRIRFLQVTMTGRFSNFNSISYTEDQQELRVTGKKCRQPDTMSGTGQIFISGAVRVVGGTVFHDNIFFSDGIRDLGIIDHTHNTHSLPPGVTPNLPLKVKG